MNPPFFNLILSDASISEAHVNHNNIGINFLESFLHVILVKNSSELSQLHLYFSSSVEGGHKKLWKTEDFFFFTLKPFNFVWSGFSL